MKVSVPAAKKRKVQTLAWETSEMPSIPILMNPKALTKHTQLLSYQKIEERKKAPAEKKKEDGTEGDDGGKKAPKEGGKKALKADANKAPLSK